MKKELHIEIIQEEIAEIVTQLSSHNIKEVVEALQGQIDILKAVDAAVFFSGNSEISTTKSDDVQGEQSSEMSSVKDDDSNQKDIIENNDEESISPEPGEFTAEEVLNDGNTIRGFFTQALNGGTMHHKKKLFVPESVCRNNELKTGDFLEANQVGWTRNNHPEYDFKVLRKSTKEAPEIRKLHEFLPVKKNSELKRLYVEITVSDSTMGHPILLSEYDINKYHLNEGDLVTYAHNIDDTMNGRVIWKHPISSRIQVLSSKKPQHRRDKEKKPPVKKTQPIFEDLRIMMIGGRAKAISKAIEPEIKSRSGEFIYLNGDEPHKSLESKIPKADIVVIYTQSISHEAALLAKDICKKNNIVHTYTKNLGATGFVRRVSLLKKKLIENKSAEKNNG